MARHDHPVATLEVATGPVRAGHYPPRRRVEFGDFMDGLVAAYTQRRMHVVLDNLNTHKPPRDRRLARHPEVHFHYIPTHASWLNQAEIWFSLLSRSSLAGAIFTSPGNCAATSTSLWRPITRASIPSSGRNRSSSKNTPGIVY